MKDAKKTGFPEQEENNLGIDINTDENQSGTTHLNEPLTDEPEVEKLKLQLEEQKEKFLRQAAEFDNFKRRSAKERIDLVQTAGREIITDLLEVLDDCDRAQRELEVKEGVKEIKEGVMLVFNKLRNVLTSKGLKAMDSLGQEFNPDLHEAITEIPAPSKELAGKVIDVLQKGYYLNGKIIRFAKVVVGK